MFRVFLHLLGRTWTHLLVMLGTTTTAVIVFSLVGPLLIFIPRMVEAHRLKNTGLSASIKAVAASLLDWSTLIAPAVTLVIWLGLFSWSLVATVYNDHKSLQDALSSSREEAKKQKEDAAAAQNEVARQVSANADINNRLRTQGKPSGGEPILETVTVRLIDGYEYGAFYVKAVTLQTDTINAGTGPAYNVVVQQSAVTGLDWSFDDKNMNERRTEILAAGQGTLTTTSIAPMVDLEKLPKQQFPPTYVYGNVAYDNRSSEGSKHHAYSYCYYLFAWNNRATPPEPIGKFVECPKQPAVRGRKF